VYPVIGDRLMSTIRRSDVQRVVTLAAERNAPGTVEVIYAYTSAVFKAAAVDRVVSSSPCVKIKLPERQRIVPLSTDQVGVIAGWVDARYRALVLVAAATGLRSGELRGLTVDRIAPALHLRTAVPAKRVTLRIDRQLAGIDEGEPVFAPAKTDAADRSVPVGASVAELLAQHLAAHGPGNGGVVFSLTGGQPIDRSRAGHIWRAAADGMNLRPRSGWHDLRHHHASLLIAAGLSPRAVADRLGHKDAAETLTVYAHLWVDDEDRAVDATELALAGVLLCAPDVRRATARDAAAQVNGLTVLRRPASGLQASSSHTRQLTDARAPSPGFPAGGSPTAEAGVNRSSTPAQRPRRCLTPPTAAGGRAPGPSLRCVQPRSRRPPVRSPTAASAAWRSHCRRGSPMSRFG
jgi:integrase